MKIFKIFLLEFLGIVPFFVEAQIKNLRFFGLWLGAGPQANILEVSMTLPSAVYGSLIISQFRSTLIIPTGLPDSVLKDGVQAIWPGLEPPQMNSVFQNVITNGDTVGEWSQLPFYCCKLVIRTEKCIPV